MPKQLVLSRVPVDLSIVEFDLNQEEDLFLTYMWERAEGPDIRRAGQGPPYMNLIGGGPGETTTDPFGLRLGTWLIQEEMRQDELQEAREKLREAQANRDQQAIRALELTIDELERPAGEPGSIRAHDTVFRDLYPGYEITGHQGCGDLTMNAWNVAYTNNGLAENPPALVCLHQEPLEHRTYSCLVKWKASCSGAGRVTIEEIRFRRRSLIKEPNEMAQVRFEGRWLPRGDMIEFAVSNQQVIRDGELVPVVTICHQFGDLRHLIQMPNLNPNRPLYPGELPGPGGRYRPRMYFGQDQFGDIWFGEEAFLEDRTQNLLRGALSGPVFLDFPPGADEKRLRGAMNLAGYREVAGALEPLSPGNWRFVRRSPGVRVVEIYFKRNTYGWTMIGLSPDNRWALCLACTGRPGETGFTLEQAAVILRRVGAWNALLMDEGADVFQKVRGEDGRLTDMVPRIRRRLRATFIFARPAFGLGCLPSPRGSEDPGYLPPQVDLPPQLDRHRRMLLPRDQGKEPTCVGFAAVVAREAVLSEPVLLSPRYLYHFCKQADGIPDLEGTYLRVAMQVLRQRGTCEEEIWPYQLRTDKPPGPSDESALRFRIAGFLRLDGADPQTMLRNMKHWLQRHPFIAGVWVHEGWCMRQAVKTGQIPDFAGPERRLGGHAICVVGYNEKQHHFIFKNSWGEDWGDKGYGYLSYNYMASNCFEAWGIQLGSD